MQIYESLSRKDLEERFKPVQLPPPTTWPFSQTLIQNIVKRQTTPTGGVIYLVQFKDGQTKKISANVLNESHKGIVEDFELELFRSKEQPSKRRKLTVNRRNSRPALKKVKAQYDFNSDTSDSMSNFIVNSSDDEDAETTSQSQSFAITRSGRQTNKKMSFEKEFYPNGVKTKGKKATQIANVSLYENSDFIKYHSEHCFRCDGTGYCNGPVEVPIGPAAKRMRLLLCKTCSYSVHNNCLPNGRTQIINNGQYQCVKCSGKKSVCQYDFTPLTRKSEDEVPFRCNACSRGFHQRCITISASSELVDKTVDLEMDDLYAKGLCIDCLNFGMRPGTVVGERMLGNKKELLIKWKNTSYRHTNWVSENWYMHAQQVAYRYYLKKKSEPNFEVRSSIPVEWKTVDRILNVEWENKSILKAKRILAVYKDISYEEAVWDDPPSENDTELFPDYKLALQRYIQASKVTPPENMPQLVANVRRLALKEGYEKHEFKSQPNFITGGTLMKHQLEALNWLLFQWEQKQSCILADDMGLGKTIQIISFLYVLFKKYSIYPFIIVVPNSTATNWVREFQKWAPEMTVAPYFGGKVGRKLAMDNEILDKNRRLKCHVVVTTYESSLITNDLHRMFWPVMVVDESQRLKNDESLLFKTLKEYKVDQITLLTGTPLQNNIKELFNIMNFIQPQSFHGSEAVNYDDMNQAKVEDLHKRLRPHFLRRTKEEVLKSLPPKYELIVPLSMTPIQKEVYKECLNRDIYETLSRATGAKVQRGLSSILMNLRKVLNHPYLLDGVEREQKTAEEVQTAMINASAKLKVFHQMFPKLKAQGHRMLIFSTMTRTLDILEDYFNFENIRYTRIDGSCNERDRVRSIDAFNAPNSPLDVFLLSTRAGGVGINLATADTIVIWDSDFNPYADLQAISRAHRIGQNKMVLILRFMTRLSVEEKVLQIAKKKMSIEHVVVERMKENDEESYEDVESILKFGTKALFSDDNSKDIHYDSASLDSLLDREKYRDAAVKAQEEEIAAAEEGNKKATEQGLNFSFAKVWKKDGSLEDVESEDKSANDSNEEDFWQKFLKEKEAEEAEKKEKLRLAAETLGRGARKRIAVTYTENLKAAANDNFEVDAYIPGPEHEDEDEDEDNNEAPKAPRLIRINGPRREELTYSNNSLLQMQNSNSSLWNPQIPQRQGQQQQQQPIRLIQPQSSSQSLPIHQQSIPQLQQQQQSSHLHPNSERMMYDEMLKVFQPRLNALKLLAISAYSRDAQHSEEFTRSTDELYHRSMKELYDHYQTRFNTIYRSGEAASIAQKDSIKAEQKAMLDRNMKAVASFIYKEMEECFQQLAFNTQREQALRDRAMMQSESKAKHNTLQQSQQMYPTQSTTQPYTTQAQGFQHRHPQQNRVNPPLQPMPQYPQQNVALPSSQPMKQNLRLSAPQQTQHNVKLATPHQTQHQAASSSSSQIQQITKVPSYQLNQNMVTTFPQQANHNMLHALTQQTHQGASSLLQQPEQKPSIGNSWPLQQGQFYGQTQPTPQNTNIAQVSQQGSGPPSNPVFDADTIQKALDIIQKRALKDAKEKARREAKERQIRKNEEIARKQAAFERQCRDQVERDRVERERSERISQEARDIVERERIKIIREQAERVARERAEREAQEQNERKIREQAERAAREQSEREAREQAEREAKEQAERDSRKNAEREAREDAERRNQSNLNEQSRQVRQLQEHLRNEQTKNAQQTSTSAVGSQPVPQLPEVMTPSMIMSMANYFSQHQGQNISSQELLTHINQIAQKEAEEKQQAQLRTQKEAEEKRQAQFNSEEQRTLDYLVSQSKLKEETAKAMLENERKRQAQSFDNLRSHMMSNVNNMNPDSPMYRLQEQYLQQHETQQQIDTQFTNIDPSLLARNNAAYFKNVSPQIQRTLFSTPPPQPDPSYSNQFEKSIAISNSPTPSSPAKLRYPTEDESNFIEQQSKDP